MRVESTAIPAVLASVKATIKEKGSHLVQRYPTYVWSLVHENTFGVS